MIWLPDSNVVFASVVDGHLHFGAAADWFAAHAQFATCPITQGALLRLQIRFGVSPVRALGVLESITATAGHAFWPDAIGYDGDVLRGVTGHADVTDAYLAALARHYRGRVATFDRRFARHHPDAVDLVVSS